MIAQYGCDALRAYILFMAPPDKDLEWSFEGLEGMFRFLGRVWRFVGESAEQAASGAEWWPHGDPASKKLHREMHRVIAKVTDDIGRFQFNTAIAAHDGADQLRVRLPPRRREPARATSRLLRRGRRDAHAAARALRARTCAEEMWREVLGHDRVRTSRRVAGVRPVGMLWPTRSSSPCRSTARCAARSPLPRTFRKTASSPRRWPLSPPTSKARTSRRSSSWPASS